MHKMATTHLCDNAQKAAGGKLIVGLGATYPAILFAIAIVIFTITRLGLFFFSLEEVPASLAPFFIGRGIWFDVVTLAVALSPTLLVNALLPDRFRRSPAFRWFSRVVIFLWVVFLLFTAVGEFFFWDEFSTRFNFIAVDYLVYTQEVLANIFQSYPVKTLLCVIGLVAILAVWLLRGWLRQIESTSYGVQTRLAMFALALGGPLLLFVASIGQMHGSGNAYADELSGNGLFSLVSAFFLSELDYEQFYATLPEARTAEILVGLGVDRQRQGARSPEGGAEQAALPSYLKRRPKNVVLVTVESLSAKFLGAYGNKDGLTPNLDRLAHEGLLFDKLFATGTRTVRGLEAVSLGIPPTPGQAIVHRPGSDHLISLGGLLAREGFRTTFAYGGNAFFDNMSAFFGGNSYAVFDKGEFSKNSIAFENAWGVADESLFANVVAELDRQEIAGAPFFMHVMTTSNHRPYTYPDGRIDIPSPGGRDGAVKYADFAIGEFLKTAATKPWFADTLFVILADHCASAAGKTEIPVSGYWIPMIFYGPEIVSPGHITQMESQIDISPTLLRVLGLPGESIFYGRAVTGQDRGYDRAFIGTYQSLGYLKNDILTVLRPKRSIEAYHVDPTTLQSEQIVVDPQLRDEAIAYYQTASREFRTGALRAPW